MKPRNTRLKQRGVTFLEILAVLVILVLIYLAYARSFGQGTDKAKNSNVQNSFKQYQIGFENSMDEASGLPSSNGINTDYSLLNKYFNKDFQITSPTSGTGTVHPTANPIQSSSMKDPWGSNYQVEADYISNNEAMLLVRSAGKDKTSTVTNDLFVYGGSGTSDSDDILMVSHYLNGTVKSCTKGLSKDLGGIKIIDYDVPYDYAGSTTNIYAYKARSYFISTYSHEYAMLFKSPTGKLYRTFAYANVPLNLYLTPFGDVADSGDNSFYVYEWWSPVTSPLTFIITPEPPDVSLISSSATRLYLKGMTFLGATEVDYVKMPTVTGCN